MIGLNFEHLFEIDQWYAYIHWLVYNTWLTIIGQITGLCEQFYVHCFWGDYFIWFLYKKKLKMLMYFKVLEIAI